MQHVLAFKLVGRAIAHLNIREKSLHCTVANVLKDDILVNEFEVKSRYFVNFLTKSLAKSMKTLAHP